VEDAWVSLVSRAALRRLLERAPELAVDVMHALETQLEHVALAAGALSAMRVEERLMATFVRLAMRHATVTIEGVELSLRLSHSQWATLVGASRAAVTASLIRLRRRGAVRCEGRMVVLPHDVLFGALEQWAGAPLPAVAQAVP
jgi:CRP-like cAMP-binding protein